MIVLNYSNFVLVSIEDFEEEEDGYLLPMVNISHRNSDVSMSKSNTQAATPHVENEKDEAGYSVPMTLHSGASEFSPEDENGYLLPTTGISNQNKDSISSYSNLAIETKNSPPTADNEPYVNIERS